LVLVSLPAVLGFLSFLPPLFLSLSLSPTNLCFFRCSIVYIEFGGW
jgi:hypothetical protein